MLLACLQIGARAIRIDVSRRSDWWNVVVPGRVRRDPLGRTSSRGEKCAMTVHRDQPLSARNLDDPQDHRWPAGADHRHHVNDVTRRRRSG